MKECQYKKNCRSYPSKCITCVNNPDYKEDHYVPGDKIWPSIKPIEPTWPMTRPDTTKPYIINVAGDQPCLAEALDKQIRKERNLPDGAIVPLLINCPCPKCSGRITC